MVSFGFLMNTSQTEITLSSTAYRSRASSSGLSEEQSWVLMQCDSHSDKTVSKLVDVTPGPEVTHMLSCQLFVIIMTDA